MKTVQHTLRFVTPAFLGDAQQNGRWRTPPIKHELRHWWRVAYAADHGFRVSVADMRREEGLLFGNAWLSHRVGRRDQNTFTKSLVRLRLDRWDDGRLKKTQWPRDHSVIHPEVRSPVGSALYLGYGPLLFSGGTTLKANAAIQAGEEDLLSLAWPESFPRDLQTALKETGAPDIWPERIDARLRCALWLADRYGTLGGRARNGWGSYHLLPFPAAEGAGGLPLRDWQECLNLDWPHAIGKDEKGPLIWQTEAHEDWKSLMRTLAIVKIGLRTQFLFTTGRGALRPEDRHWLAYPVTNHDVRAWSALRLPNQLRFKARQTADGKLVGIIFHMPHLPPPAFKPHRPAIENVWRCVHEFLDATTLPPAQRRYCSMADGPALAKQKQQLDGVILKRVSE